MFLTEFFRFLIENNTLKDYGESLIIFAVLFAFFKIFDFYVIHVLKKFTKKTKITWDDVVVDFIEGIHWPFYAYLAFYFATLPLTLQDFLSKILYYVLLMFIVFYVAKGLINISEHWIERYKKKREKESKTISESMISVMKVIIKLLIWSLALLMILSNLGVQITPLIASLGIGGLAIGLALQNVLGDLFSAFVIYFDKPFEEGDFIVTKKDMGFIKRVGIKTTRIQALSGEEIIIPNSELTSSRINNYKKMKTRRIVFSFGVEYDTSVKQLKKIKKIVERIISKEEFAVLDRVHFKSFGDSSLNFEVVYSVKSNDYNIYMDTQERINLQLKEALEKEGINFAFPSTTVYLRQDD